ncbi:MAG: EAL domain-containing protein [Oscillospiraceae bacterium]|nr:EAL domain-containing protein [Oscillospiraceae bacterium]
MKNLKRILIVFSLLAVFAFAASVYADNTYDAGILSDYEFSGNSVSQYARASISDVFEESLFSMLNMTGDYKLSEGLDALSDGQIDFLCMVPASESLLTSVDYTSEPMATGFLTLLTSIESDIYFENFLSFNNMKIGLIKDSYFEERLRRYASEHGFNYIPVYFTTIDELTSAAVSGDIDAILSPVTEAPEGLRIAAKLGNISYYCAVKKGDKETLDFLNGLLAEHKKLSPFYIQNLYQDYFRIPYANMIPFTTENMRASKTQKKLRVFVSNSHYPMAYLDQETSEYTGIYIDVLKKVAANCGLELVYIPGEQEDITMNSIVIGRADIILTVTGSSQGLIEASKPYASLKYVPVVKNNNEISEEGEHRIGIVRDDIWIEDYLTAQYPTWTIKEYGSVNSLLTAADFGRVDAALISSIDMQTKLSLTTHPKLSIFENLNVVVPVSFGISKVTCPQDVVNLINDAISNTPTDIEADTGVITYIMGNTYVPNIRDIVYEYKWLIMLVIIVFALVIIIFKLRERYFKKLSQSDSLTNIHNSMYFYKAAEKMLAKNPDLPHLLASLDARNFKLINDRFGRIIGDQTLVSISNEIAKIFKDEGLYARLQGDNFIILVEDTPENKRRLAALEHIDIHIHDSSEYRVPIKTGVCPIPAYDPAIPLSSYIDKANIAKDDKQGRSANYLRYFTNEMADQLNTKNVIEVEMVHALNRGEFIVFYQPKYELNTDKIIGAEALVRWNHRERGLMSPSVFVPLFEQNGFILNLDFYVYKSVFKMMKERLKKKQPMVPISMNVSRCHLIDKGFAEKLDKLVSEYKIPKEYIEMEITESIFSEEDSYAVSLLYELKERGFSISMDDFGSGYSSLNLLRELPIDTLKIDKVFIDNAETSERGRVIVEAILEMASKIQLKTICEGVETKEQRDFLKEAGCDMVQGFFYSRPLPCRDFEALLDSSN